MKKYLLLLPVLLLAGCAGQQEPGRSAVLGQRQGISFAVSKDQSVSFRPPAHQNPGDFGILTAENGGYAEDLWSGADSGALPLVLPVKAGAGNFKTMLLTSAVAPDGAGTEWLRARILTLLWMNERQAATKLAYASLRERDLAGDENLQMIQLLFWTHQKESACLEVLRASQQNANPQGRTLRALCFAMMAQKDKAQQVWNETRPALDDESLSLYVDALLNGAPLPEFPERHPLRTALAFARNQVTGQNADLPAPLFIEEKREAWLQNRPYPRALDIEEHIAQFQEAAVKKQKGRIMLMTYVLAEKAKKAEEKLDPVLMEAIISAWQQMGWRVEADRLRTELNAQ